MEQTISIEEVISIIQKSDLDQTIKDILIRDVKKEGVTEFLLEQVIAYCDNTIEVIKDRMAKEQQDQAA
ncbi:MAG: hypothetical protein HYZ51_03440 [Candidatus Doudnabacteria bacterium]|nr:hypothetical protein [Candidatus Doudnabacteria bacterium]